MLPQTYLDFKERFAEIIGKYDELGGKIHDFGPLDVRSRRLVALAYAIALGTEGGTHAQVRKALKNGVSEEELFHVMLLGLPALGLARTVAGYSWIQDILKKAK
ncbi:MAG: carboxymuconolactone decarboxylase family protein [Candidatus Hodarchaeales archaeon]|jgi:alkylhydroperoxidase/carboxymuconolactone decarboxylase family protein YurZ